MGTPGASRSEDGRDEERVKCESFGAVSVLTPQTRLWDCPFFTLFKVTAGVYPKNNSLSLAFELGTFSPSKYAAGRLSAAAWEKSVAFWVSYWTGHNLVSLPNTTYFFPGLSHPAKSAFQHVGLSKEEACWQIGARCRSRRTDRLPQENRLCSPEVFLLDIIIKVR